MDWTLLLIGVYPEAAFVLFEWCVGMYFPCISTVKSHVVPDRVSALADLARVEQSLAQATAMTACPYLYA